MTENKSPIGITELVEAASDLAKTESAFTQEAEPQWFATWAARSLRTMSTQMQELAQLKRAVEAYSSGMNAAAGMIVEIGTLMESSNAEVVWVPDLHAAINKNASTIVGSGYKAEGHLQHQDPEKARDHALARLEEYLEIMNAEKLKTQTKKDISKKALHRNLMKTLNSLPGRIEAVKKEVAERKQRELKRKSKRGGNLIDFAARARQVVAQTDEK